jgi:chromosome segregation ATPase
MSRARADLVTQNPPSIAERVHFWEEQQKINDLLVPRVVELHEKVTEMGLVVQNTAKIAYRVKSDSDFMRGEYDKMIANFNKIRDDANKAADTFKDPIRNIEKLNTIVNKIESMVRGIDEDVAALASSSKQNAAQINGINIQLGSIHANIESINDSIATAKKQLDKARTDLTANRALIDEHSEDISVITKNANQLQSDHSALVVRHDLLQQRVKDTEAQLQKYWNRGSIIPTVVAFVAAVLAIVL